MTYAQAAVVLGVHPRTVARMIRRGELAAPPNWPRAGLARSDVERLSLARWRPGDKTWLTATQVGEQLGLSLPRICQLSDADMLPYERGPDGRRLYRPGQIAVIVEARKVRRSAVRTDPATRGGSRPTLARGRRDLLDVEQDAS